MKRQLSNKEAKEINAIMQEMYGVEDFLKKKDKIELIEDGGFRIISVDGQTSLFYRGDIPAPHIKCLLKDNFLKKITVDMGAVRFVINGADIMRPGIVKIDESIRKDDTVAIIDQNYGKPLAVGIAMMDHDAMLAQTSGKCVKNLHWVGDKIWTL